MDWVQRWLLTFLASVVAIVYWLLAARARSAAKSRRQSQVAQGHHPDHSVPERIQDQTRKRLTIVYPEQTRVAADDAEVDIVAVHGLGSDADWSWICKDGEKHINWLRDPDMLPAQVPRARIIVYRYESTWHIDAPKTRLQLCGEELVHSLHSFRASRPSRPLVFVGHSLGGNVVMQAFLYANDDGKYESLVNTTVGLVFLGTPFRGSKWQPLADALAQLMGPAGSHRGITRELGFDEPALRDRVHRFCKLRNKLSTAVACFSELHETDYGRWLGIAGVVKGMIVDETSACIPGLDRYALDKDHLKINKYYGPTDPAFERVSGVISEMCRRANNVVRRRFERREIIIDNHAALKYNPKAEACLHDLFVTDPLEDKKALKRKKGDRAAGTCEWILGTDDLTAWLGPSHNQNSEIHTSQVLWLHGNPGTVRGLLLQLIQQHPPLLSYVLPKYNERGAKLFESFDALWAIFISAAADRNTGRKYCIIDALDECDDESQRTLLRQLQETFHSSDAPKNIRILVTSRPYREIRKHLEIFTNKDLASFPDVKRDIDQCIKERVAQLKYTEKIKGRVTEILRDKAGGTFLWVGIACNELEDTPSKDAISCLEAMPSGLHSLYEKLLSAALEREKEKGTIRLVLSFVAVSQRPLHLLQLSEACRLRQDEDDIETRTQFMREYIESCRLMVVIQDEEVLLLHQSVKDYLIKAGDQARFSELQAHADLAYRCLDYLIEQFQDTKQAHADFSDYATCERPNDVDFSHYATSQWPNHARMARSRFQILPPQGKFFETPSPYLEYWLALRRRFGRGLDNIPKRSSILHVAARWGIPVIAEHVSCFYSLYNNAQELIHLVDASESTPIECAVESEYPNVVPILLDMGAVVTEKVLRAAAGNEENGKLVMSLLLELRGEEISVTEKVLRTAAGNKKSGKEVMSLLLEQRGEEIAVTEKVLRTAAGNEESGKEVMSLLLEQRGDEITISDDVLWAAAGNANSGRAVMTLLLEQRGNEITITDDLVRTAAAIDERGEDEDGFGFIDDGVWVVAGMGLSGGQMIGLLLECRNVKIAITHGAHATVATCFGKGVLALLLERRGEVTFTEEVVKSVAENEENGEELLALLLEKRGDEIAITEEVVKAAAGNLVHGPGMMALLLEKRGDEIAITEEVVKAAARLEMRGMEVMALLLEQRGDEIAITEEVVKAAAENKESGGEVVAMLLEKRGDKFNITDEIVVTIAREFDTEVMALLLEKRGDEIAITEEVVKAAAGNYSCGEEMMALLLEKRGEEIAITDDVVKASLRNKGNGMKVMALLLEQRGEEVTITGDIVKAALRNTATEVLVFVYDRLWDKITITEEMVNRFTATFTEKAMLLLLEWRGGTIIITDEIIATIAKEFSRKVMAMLLEQRGYDITISEEVVKAAAGNLFCGEKVMALLLEQPGDEVNITEEVVKAAARNERRGMKLMALLLEQRGEEIAVTEKVLRAAAGNEESGKEVMSLLLEQRGDEIAITEEVVKAAAENKESGGEVVAMLLEKRGDKFNITDEIVVTIAREFDTEVMALLLEQRGDEIAVTEKVLKAAAGNVFCGKEVTALLLEQRGGVCPTS